MSKQYFAPETKITWKASGGDRALTLTSLADQQARVGQQLDRGTGAKPGLYKWYFKGRGSTTITVGRQIRLHGAGSHNGGDIPGRVGTSDATISSSAADRLRNVRGFGVINADTTSSGEDLIGEGTLMILTRYWSPVVFNDLGQALSATAGDFELVLEPVPPEMQ